MVFENSEAIINAFDAFRQELDDAKDKSERLIKSSRELTLQSKRLIFLLHRLATESSQGESGHQKAAVTAQEKLHRIKNTLFPQILKEVNGEQEFWQFQRDIRGGMEEYAEAVSYAHYLSKGKLITHSEILQWITPDETERKIPLPYAQYLLGISDLTGELMRLAITAIARGGGRTQAEVISDFVRKCKSDFEPFTPFIRELSKKQQVTKQSVRKIEEANYAVKLRSAEFGSDPEMLDRWVQGSLMLQQQRSFEVDDGVDDY